MKYKAMTIFYIFAAGFACVSAQLQFKNVPLSSDKSYDGLISDGFLRPCPECPPAAVPTPTPPPPITPPQPTACNNCATPDCSTLPNGSNVPYPNHCQFYWTCQNGVAIISYCPNGFWYDRVRRICDYCPNVTNCPANTD